MASIYFNDYAFPSELYRRDTMDFTIPIRTLLDFTPHILQELPKDPEEQKPLKMQEQPHQQEESSAHAFVRRNNRHIEGFLNFVAERCMEYIASSASEGRRQEEEHRQQERSGFSQTASFASHKEECVKKQQDKDEEAKKKNQQQRNMITQSVVAVGALSFSAYSTYQASAAWGDVTFQNQLELLLDHVEEILKSTTIWVEEHDKMGDPIPDLVRHDIARLKRLIDQLVRLDSRSKRRQETAGWGMGVAGGLSVLGGVALGSAAMLTGGAAVAIGGVLVTVAAKGSSRASAGARALLEAEAVRVLREIEKEAVNRQTMLANGFESIVLSQAPSPSNVLPIPSSPRKNKMKEEAL